MLIFKGKLAFSIFTHKFVRCIVKTISFLHNFRVNDQAISSVFNFPKHLNKSVKTRRVLIRTDPCTTGNSTFRKLKNLRWIQHTSNSLARYRLLISETRNSPEKTKSRAKHWLRNNHRVRLVLRVK